MNEEKVRKVIQVWLKHIDKNETFGLNKDETINNINGLEKDMNSSLEDLLVNVIKYVYEEYSEEIKYVPVKFDTYDKYIFKPINGAYSLEDFLLNRLLRSVESIEYTDMCLWSEYSHDFNNIQIERKRIKEHLANDPDRARKLVAHEFLHSLITQFTGKEMRYSESYESIKDELRIIFGTEAISPSIPKSDNNFYEEPYLHSGFTFSSKITKNNPQLKYNIENLDEIFNEHDSIKASNDNYGCFVSMNKENNILLICANPESSNSYITNYAPMISCLFNKGFKFIGQYIDPEIVYNFINNHYSKIFQKNYKSEENALTIICKELSELKQNPKDIDKHIKLTNTLYECAKLSQLLFKKNEEEIQKDLKTFAISGLFDSSTGKKLPLQDFAYTEEYMALKAKKHQNK